MKPSFTETIPNIRWEFTGNEGNKFARLLATIQINSLWMHLEAIQVEEVYGLQQSVDPYWQERFEYYHLASGADGIYETTEIMGRNYALFASPFCA